MIKISVIIPVHDASEYLHNCLESVMNQTLSELEIICVDDGSTDNSLTYLQEIKKRDSRILVFSQKNMGAGAARNYGLTQAHGEYISFLDADDDYYEPIALEIMYDSVKHYDAEVGAAFKKTRCHEKISDHPCFHEFSDMANAPLWVSFEKWQDDFHFHSFIYRHSFLAENAIRFPLYLRYQDPPFLLNVMVHAGKFLLIPTVLYCHRSREHRLSLNEQQVYDLLCGIYDNMKISRKMGYEFLYRKQISRINERYYQDIMNNLSSDVFGMLSIIEKFHQEIFIHEEIKPFQDIRQYAVQKKYTEFLFPFHLLRHNDRFIIYGAGVMGHALYYQWCRYGENFGTLVAIVDQNAEQFANHEFQVLHPNRLKNLNFNTILIAIKNSSISKEVQKYLIELGISKHKIILCGKSCIADPISGGIPVG